MVGGGAGATDGRAGAGGLDGCRVFWTNPEFVTGINPPCVGGTEWGILFPGPVLTCDWWEAPKPGPVCIGWKVEPWSRYREKIRLSITVWAVHITPHQSFNSKSSADLRTGYNWEPSVGCWYFSTFDRAGGFEGIKVMGGWVVAGGGGNLSYKNNMYKSYEIVCTPGTLG